jgi:hypothetical protein
MATDIDKWEMITVNENFKWNEILKIVGLGR